MATPTGPSESRVSRVRRLSWRPGPGSTSCPASATSCTSRSRPTSTRASSSGSRSRGESPYDVVGRDDLGEQAQRVVDDGVGVGDRNAAYGVARQHDLVAVV